MDSYSISLLVLPSYIIVLFKFLTSFFQVFGIYLKTLLLLFSALLGFWQIGGYLGVIFTGGVGKNGSTVAVRFQI